MAVADANPSKQSLQPRSITSLTLVAAPAADTTAAVAATYVDSESIVQIFDEASPHLYDAVHGLMSAVLCDPVTSPFLEAVASPAGVKDGRDRAVVTWQRPLLAGLACLGAHEDLGQRALLLVGLWGLTSRRLLSILSLFEKSIAAVLWLRSRLVLTADCLQEGARTTSF